MMRLRAYAALAREAFGMAEDLAALAILEAGTEVQQRARHLSALIAATLLLLLGLIFGGIALLVALRDTPYLTTAAVGLMLVPLAVGAFIAIRTLHAWRAKAWLPATRTESREFFQWLKTKL